MSTVRARLRYLAIAGNIVFILWIVRNGINEGFRGTPLEVVSCIGLLVLLSVNAVLLWDRSA